MMRGPPRSPLFPYPTLFRSARQRDGGLAELAARAEEEAAALTRAWVLPLAPGYRLTAGFGECSSLWAHCHTGLDFATSTGTPIRAVARGTIKIGRASCRERV